MTYSKLPTTTIIVSVLWPPITHTISSPCIYSPHGICYGFQVMHSCESLTIRSRFLHHHFQLRLRTPMHLNDMLNRKPALYKETWFYVDQLHWRGHLGSNRCYCTCTTQGSKLASKQAGKRWITTNMMTTSRHNNTFIFNIIVTTVMCIIQV